MKKNLTLLGILVVLTGAFFYLNQAEKQSQRAHISDFSFAVDSTKVNRIEIQRAQDPEPVILEKRSNEWHVTRPVDYPANPDFVESLLSRAAAMKVIARVSSNPAKQSQFQVDSTGTLVKISQSDDLTAEFVLGKAGSGGVTYVRPPDSDEVLSVDGYLASIFNRRPVDWRDKTITSFERQELQSIQLVQGDDILTISRRPGGSEEWDIIRQGDAEVYYGDVTRINQIVSTLGRFNTTDFKDNPDSLMVTAFAAPDSSVMVTLKDGRQIIIFVEPENEAASRYLIKRKDKGDQVYFVASKTVIDNIFANLDELKTDPPPQTEPAIPMPQEENAATESSPGNNES